MLTQAKPVNLRQDFDPSLRVMRLGLKSFSEVWRLQKSIQRKLIERQTPDTLILCQHFPVVTCGRNSKPENLLFSSQELTKKGIELLHIERGGDVTFHGPGQLVAYPLMDLRIRKRDVHWYMRSLEEVIIRTLKTFGLNSERIEGKTGVWVKRPDDSMAKIGSQGVRISRWCTLHGLALNVLDCSYGFSTINPCGFRNIEVTSLEQEGIHCDLVGAASVLEENFKKVFGY